MAKQLVEVLAEIKQHQECDHGSHQKVQQNEGKRGCIGLFLVLNLVHVPSIHKNYQNFE